MAFNFEYSISFLSHQSTFSRFSDVPTNAISWTRGRILGRGQEGEGETNSQGAETGCRGIGPSMLEGTVLALWILYTKTTKM